ncbi:PEP-CTERM-box response regulator transcription factor [candidate division KSB3 bacterium]|uniref:PEP-CTERM-box response regulator transcription factor n=1 Tax=candidate division KSB3 bacterium TaxID=2044937 RepID=A0A2G6E957_9BACT|nr:MAG: PEP-CTERM-box response regulator transcription factor [candidate division KSB3 bacterium]PIE30606.1 MAG: PEP-CTERM-box response regulator transcription factor [candidate division KSB3 bacterium]
MADTEKKHLLIVDDDRNIRKQMKWSLAKEYTVLQAEDRQGAVKICREHKPGVMTLDLGLPPDPDGSSEGLRTLQEMLKINPKIKAIIITGNQERSNALKAIELGAYDFQNKPVQLDELQIVLRRAYRLYELEEELTQLRAHPSYDQGFEGIIGESASMQHIFGIIEKVATTDTSVLITGESGVGKELIAQALHARSLRKGGPFIPINCAAIPENLLESELFGYERGAFTGAQTRKLGKLELAHEGTLFLDEMGELGQPLQAKLLRFLQDQIIERVGGKEQIQLNVRVLAATNRDLDEAIKAKRFREDLFFRLNEILIVVPPLRSRSRDALLLAKLFLHRFAQENNRPIKGISPSAQKLIQEYPWPGNVRELRSRIKRAVVMADDTLIKPVDLDLHTTTTMLTLKEAREELEQRLVREALERQQGNITKASKQLGITRPTLHDLMRKYSISKEDFSA